MTAVSPEFQIYIPIGGGYEVGIHKVVLNSADSYEFNCKKLRRADGAVLPSIRTLGIGNQFTLIDRVLATTTKETVRLSLAASALAAHGGPPQKYYQAGLHFGGGNLGE